MTVLETRKEADIFAPAFAAVQREGHSHPLSDVRAEAFDRFTRRGFPTTREEAWRYTSLARLARTPFERTAPAVSSRPSAERIRALCFGGGTFIELVFVDGRLDPSLSTVPSLDGEAYVGSLASAPPRLVSMVRDAARDREATEPLDALNLALTEDGALVYLPRDARLPSPVHLVFVTTAHERPVATHPRTLVMVEAGAHLSLVESYVSDGGTGYLTNAVTDVRVAESGKVDHYKMQRESIDAAHIASLHVKAATGAQFRSFFVSTGGGLVRNEIHAPLEAPEVECRMYGLYLLDADQHCDSHTVIHHGQPRCTSEQVYKGILDGHSHGVFSGSVHVAVDAQKTDAHQSNKNLLLSDDATITTRPQLEIRADDVKCTHGVAIGSLDETQFYYLRARGIGPQEARDILTYAFASELLSRIEIDAVRIDVERRISSGLAADSESLREER